MAKGYILHMYDPTTCGGRVLEGAPNRRTNGTPVARMCDKVSCGKNRGIYQIIGGISWITTEGRLVAGSLNSFSSCPCNAKIIPQITVQTYESRSESRTSAPVAATTPPTIVSSNSSPVVSPAALLPVSVFAKSRERGTGNTDAGKQQEPHTNFAEMGLFRAAPAADSVTDADAPQHAQTAKKKPPAPEDIPKPKKRSALYKWLNGNHEEVQYRPLLQSLPVRPEHRQPPQALVFWNKLPGDLRLMEHGRYEVRKLPLVALVPPLPDSW